MLTGHWHCGHCGEPFEHQADADACCEHAKDIEAAQCGMDETDRRLARMETELEKTKAAQIDGALREAAMLDRAEKAEAALREIDELLARLEADYVVDGWGLIERARAAAKQVMP